VKRFHVTPKEGFVVRDPSADGAPLPAAGKDVAWSSYWERRKKEGSISVTSVAPKSGKKSKE